MKTRHVTIALCLCLSTFSLEGGAQPAPGTARGQPGPAKVSTSEIDAEVTGEARVLFVDGVKALSASRWAKAYAKFLAAWRIKPHYQIASNLGASERELGKYRDAAEHLSFYLMDPKTKEKGKEQARQHAQQLLDDVLTKIGRLTLLDLPDGAEVKVDGVAVGRAPLPGPLFVEPGSHVIDARLDEHTPKTHPVQVNAGEAVDVKLPLEKIAPPPPPPPPPTTSTAPAASTAPTVPPVTPLPDRIPNRAVLIAGGSVAGAALVTAVVFTALANGKASSAASTRAAVIKAGGSSACGAPSASCQDLHGLMQDQATYGNVAAWSFIGAGAVGAATVIYGLVAPRTAKPADVPVVPVVTPKSAGLAVGGHW
jgi:hypothetical protein